MVESDIKIYQDIYQNVFLRMDRTNVDLFLCGGASNGTQISKRDELRDILKKQSFFSILYPEDLFTELLNRKKYDLLTLENFLADNSDYIVIVAESPGSYAELGAFTNNASIIDKVYILQHTKYKNAKSFISQGPVSYVKSKDKDRVLYFNDALIGEVSNKLSRSIRRKWIFSSKRGVSRNKNINLITGQFNFIILLLYFLKSIDAKSLNNGIKAIYKLNKFEDDKFEILYKSAIRRLYKSGYIKKELNESKEAIYSLTDKGYDYSTLLLKYVHINNRTKVFNRIRMDIMEKTLYD